MDALDAISLIEEAAPERLAVLAGDLAKSVLEDASERGGLEIDLRLWAAVGAARAFLQDEISVEEVQRLAEDAFEAARGNSDMHNGVSPAALASQAAEMAMQAASRDETSDLANMARAAYFLACRSGVPERLLQNSCDACVENLEILA